MTSSRTYFHNPHYRCSEHGVQRTGLAFWYSKPRGFQSHYSRDLSTASSTASFEKSTSLHVVVMVPFVPACLKESLWISVNLRLQGKSVCVCVIAFVRALCERWRKDRYTCRTERKAFSQEERSICHPFWSSVSSLLLNFILRNWSARSSNGIDWLGLLIVSPSPMQSMQERELNWDGGADGYSRPPSYILVGHPCS